MSAGFAMTSVPDGGSVPSVHLLINSLSYFLPPLQSTSSSSSSSLPFLPELQGGAPDYSQYTDHTSLLSSLSVTAEEEFKGRRRLNELLLSENVPVKVEGPNKSGLSEKVSVFCFCVTGKGSSLYHVRLFSVVTIIFLYRKDMHLTSYWED